ncbi:LamG-like jellyroll fold domain-containing protein [Pontibacter roseus]|uniref:LamG-like jellyroll fold domain-containing protein n=1 Tax=Pontibacter roseus TaxID=336989 RepID=UPI00036DFFD3|nr:LamG-like jellyroll fold domain-containing protein [Pontibacter roseus]
MTRLVALLFLLLGLMGAAPDVVQAQVPAQVWHLNSLKKISGHKPLVSGEPKVIKIARREKAIEFDGLNDGLLLDVNPIAGAEAFEIEVTFKPYAAFPNNVEQRFLHIQEPDNPERRILIELRLNDREQWYADFFIRTEHASLTLIDSTKTHPVNEWATIKLTYQDGQLKGFVNGVEEVSGEIAYLPISAAAKTSIGTRMDQRSWFKGAIKSVRFQKLRAAVP